MTAIGSPVLWMRRDENMEPIKDRMKMRPIHAWRNFQPSMRRRIMAAAPLNTIAKVKNKCRGKTAAIHDTFPYDEVRSGLV